MVGAALFHRKRQGLVAGNRDAASNRGQKTGNGFQDCRFTTAGFAHQTQGFALGNLHRDIIHGGHPGLGPAQDLIQQRRSAIADR